MRMDSMHSWIRMGWEMGVKRVSISTCAVVHFEQSRQAGMHGHGGVNVNVSAISSPRKEFNTIWTSVVLVLNQTILDLSIVYEEDIQKYSNLRFACDIFS